MLQNCDIRHPSVHSHGRTWVTDYMITCHNTKRSDSNLAVFVGSNEYVTYLDRDIQLNISAQGRCGPSLKLKCGRFICTMDNKLCMG